MDDAPAADRSLIDGAVVRLSVGVAYSVEMERTVDLTELGVTALRSGGIPALALDGSVGVRVGKQTWFGSIASRCGLVESESTMCPDVAAGVGSGRELGVGTLVLAPELEARLVYREWFVPGTWPQLGDPPRTHAWPFIEVVAVPTIWVWTTASRPVFGVGLSGEFGFTTIGLATFGAWAEAPTDQGRYLAGDVRLAVSL